MWPIERREELAELIALLSDCAMLNSSTHVIGRMQRAIYTAGMLTRGDAKNCRTSFVDFLSGLAVAGHDSAGEMADDRKALAERLREHAACHESIADNSDEQAEWMRDLYEAARLIDAAATR